MNEVSERGWLVKILMEFMVKQFRSRGAQRHISDDMLSRFRRIPTLQGHIMIVVDESRFS